ncbi:MAG: polysaccharide pyruvyl transferase family protein [Clostridia bacterium]|jgi:hypothetical protein|nr:polysaccharide pyruvyl transferase family protein [Clostridia bacterium]
MDKCVILTWFYFNNYGTKLQSYALQKFLRNKGYNVEVANYVPVYNNEVKEKKIKTYFFNKLINLCYGKKVNKRNELFKKFTKENINFTTKKYNKEELIELNKDFENFIVGSDQVWNPNFIDNTYFFDFVDDSKNKISYAPSFAVKKIDEENKLRIKPLINRFNTISVREKNGVDILSELTEKNIDITLDPTFLLSKKEWLELINKDEVKENVEEKYILCYFLGEKQFYWDYVRKIVEKTKYKVKVIPMTRKSYLKKYDIEVATGPIEFLSLINNAKIICTDSFHGMVFSLIFNKNFSALSRFDSKDSKSQNSRIESLLNMLDLKENMIYEDYSNVQYEVNNYEKVNEIMQEKIKLSQDFIINAINNRGE